MMTAVTELIKGRAGVERPLVDLLVRPDERADLVAYGNSLASIRLSKRSVCDLEMLAVGAFSPVTTFFSERDYRSVLETMRLASGEIFPVPVTLSVDRDDGIREGTSVGLRDEKSNLLAVIDVEEVYEWHRREFQQSVLGTSDEAHPFVAESNSLAELNISGRLRVVDLPKHYDFPRHRLTPAQVRKQLAALGRRPVVAFQTRNPLHRGHEELIRRALVTTGGVLLFQPTVGMTRPGDVDHYQRVRTYEILVEKYFDKSRAILSLVPLAMRMAGPREALWHAVIRRNYGADHFIVGRDHASPGLDQSGRPFYEPYAAQELVDQFANEVGIGVLPFGEVVYVPGKNIYSELAEVVPSEDVVRLSGGSIRTAYLESGREIPEWYMRPEIARVLKDAYMPKEKRGFCVWFTGLSCSGKSTTAEILTEMLTANGRSVTLLDGDVVRTNLSAGLGYDRRGRDANIRRIGFVASEIVRHGGVAVCAAISPYSQTRHEVREMFPDGNFIEVFVDTPLSVCEQRDTKGMYAKARRNEIDNFTGISDVYESPIAAEIELETENSTAEKNAELILNYLKEAHFVK